MIARLFKSSIAWKLHAIILGIVLVMSTLCGYIYYYKTRDNKIYEHLLLKLSLVNSTPQSVSDVVGDIMLYQKSPSPGLEDRIYASIETLILSGKDILKRTDIEHEDSRYTAGGLLEILGNLHQISKYTIAEINKGTKTIELYENIELLNILTEVVQKNVSSYVASELVYAVELKDEISNRNALLGLLLTFFIFLSLMFVFLLVFFVRKTIVRPVQDLENCMERFQKDGVYTKVAVVAKDEIGSLTEAFNAMVDQLKSSVTELRKSEEKYRSIFENATEGIYQTTLQGKVISANLAAARILGYDSPDELVASSSKGDPRRHYHPAHRDELLRRLEQRDTVFGFESRMVRQDKSTIWVSLNARAVRDINGELLRIEGSFSDISERIQAEEVLKKHQEHLEELVKARTVELEIANRGLEAQTVELAVAKELADAANAAKSNFLANMSHEIRTPMNVIVGLTDVLIKSELTFSQRGYLDNIKVASKNLLEVINDILDFSKVEAGRLELETASFDLVLLFEQMADLFNNRVVQKDLELIYVIAPQVPRWLTGDAGRLIQVLTNLIENAIKFTGSGEIVVSVEPGQQAVQPEGKTFLKFQVCDTGAGIDDDVLSTLFDPFTQGDSSLTRKHEGTGLGLAICRRLVELMGGTIEAQSAPGRGSRFVFTAKLAIRKQDETVANVPEELCGLKALVVDDSDTARQVLVDMLDSLTLNVTAVDSGENALKALRTAENDPHDLVLLDMNMPEMDGLETARLMNAQMHRENDDSSLDTKTPIVILVTAYNREKVQEQLDVVGIDAMLVKPVKPSELFKAVMNLLGSVGHATVCREDEVPDLVPRLSGRRILLVEDSFLNREVAMALLKDTGLAVEVAEDGKEAVSKVTISQKGRYDAVLMDIQMPEMDGYEATRNIRDWESGLSKVNRDALTPDSDSRDNKGRGAKSRIPIIALTAHAIKGESQKCFNAGMDDYIAKPIDEQELYRVLRRWVAS